MCGSSQEAGAPPPVSLTGSLAEFVLRNSRCLRHQPQLPRKVQRIDRGCITSLICRSSNEFDAVERSNHSDTGDDEIRHGRGKKPVVGGLDLPDGEPVWSQELGLDRPIIFGRFDQQDGRLGHDRLLSKPRLPENPGLQTRVLKRTMEWSGMARIGTRESTLL
jgi:hypothetical protein